MPRRCGRNNCSSRCTGPSGCREFAASQSRFVRTLAEQIQAPLETVCAHAELLASSGEPGTVERFARIVNDDVRHLAALVDSFLRLARPSAQADTASTCPCTMS